MLYDIKNACNKEYLKFDDFEQAEKDARNAIQNYLSARKKKISLPPNIICDSEQKDWTYIFSLSNYAFGDRTSASVCVMFRNKRIKIEANAHILTNTYKEVEINTKALNEAVENYNFVGSKGCGGIRITMDPESITLNEGFINHICDAGRMIYKREDKSDIELSVEFILDQLMGALYAIETQRRYILPDEVEDNHEYLDYEECETEEEEIREEVEMSYKSSMGVQIDYDEVDYENEDREGAVITLKELKDLIKETQLRVVGQDEYVEQLAFCIYAGLNDNPKNIIVVGPTGTGKSFTVETIVGVLKTMGKNAAMIKADMSKYTPNGFQGANVNEIKGKIRRELFLERDLIIVYLDEIDKLFKEEYDGEGKNVNQDIQGEFLSMLSREGIAETEEGKEFLSKRLMFVSTGAFVGMDDLEAKHRKETVGVGFNTDKVYKKTKITENIKLEELLIEFGAIPEFIGRNNFFLKINTLTKNDYYKIATNEKYGDMYQVIDEYKKYGFNIAFRKNLIDEIVDCAYKQPMGARYIKSAFSLAAMNSFLDRLDNNQLDKEEKKLMVSKKDLE